MRHCGDTGGTIGLSLHIPLNGSFWGLHVVEKLRRWRRFDFRFGELRQSFLFIGRCAGEDFTHQRLFLPLDPSEKNEKNDSECPVADWTLTSRRIVPD